MSWIEKFRFTANDSYEPTSNALMVTLPVGISSRSALLDAYFSLLNFPGYFGFNWDALSDCLRDFHWIDQHQIIIIHQELPNLDDEALTVYLDVLSHASTSWKDEEEHTLQVIFPLADKARVIQLLNDVDR